MNLLRISTILLFCSFPAIAVSADTPSDFAAALESQDLAAVNALVENGASVETPIHDGDLTLTPLIKAASIGDVAISAYLIQQGASINATDSSGDTALIAAVRNGYAEVVQLLFNHAARIDLKNGEQFYPLSIAAASGNNEIVQILKNAGSDLNAETLGMTPLMLAAAARKRETVSLLVQLGADINRVSSITGKTALFTAVNTGDIQLVQTLIDLHANVNFRTADGTTALKTAQQGNQGNIVSVLQSAGAVQ